MAKETAPGSKPGYETLQVTTKDNITKITLNRPKMKNAINTKVRLRDFTAHKQLPCVERAAIVRKTFGGTF